jgi:hypothetical protein
MSFSNPLLYNCQSNGIAAGSTKGHGQIRIPGQNKRCTAQYDLRAGTLSVQNLYIVPAHAG